jgi:hypothetical protein
MKTRKRAWIYTIVLMQVLLILTGGCKKKDDNNTPQVPVFIVTANTVQLQGGGEGLQFYGKCTNEDVNLTKVIITAPISSQMATYDLNNGSYNKNASFPMQDDLNAYSKEIGTWNFIIVGHLADDNSSFSEETTYLVTGK